MLQLVLLTAAICLVAAEAGVRNLPAFENFVNRMRTSLPNKRINFQQDGKSGVLKLEDGVLEVGEYRTNGSVIEIVDVDISYVFEFTVAPSQRMNGFYYVRLGEPVRVSLVSSWGKVTGVDVDINLKGFKSQHLKNGGNIDEQLEEWSESAMKTNIGKSLFDILSYGGIHSVLREVTKVLGTKRGSGG